MSNPYSFFNLSLKNTLIYVSVSIVISACGGGSGSNENNVAMPPVEPDPIVEPDPTFDVVYALSRGDASNCTEVAVTLSSGEDRNTNDVLDAEEVEQTQSICKGQSSDLALITFEDHVSNEACPSTSTLVRVGMDENNDQALDPEEIKTSLYICDSILPLIPAELSINVSEDTPFSGSLMFGEEQTVTIDNIEPPQNGVFTMNENGQYTYRPNDNFVGRDELKIRYSEYGGSIQQTIRIFVEGQNDTPVANDISITVTRGAFAYFFVPAYDADFDDLTVSILSTSSDLDGFLTVDTYGWFYLLTRTLPHTFDINYQVSDASGASDQGSITVNVIDMQPNTVTDLLFHYVSAETSNATWTPTQSQENSQYELRQSDNYISESNWGDAVLAASGTNDSIQQNVTISGLNKVQVYYFAVREIDASGELGPVSNVGVHRNPGQPEISLKSASIPALTLEQGARANQTIELVNTGTSTYNFSFDILNESEEQTEAQAKQTKRRDIFRTVKKGERDNRIGAISPLGNGGPDTFGYIWMDSDEANGPTFSWSDIRGSGVDITHQFTDDSTTSPIPLGFDFPFYGEIYSDVVISSNGFITFLSNISNGCCAGQPLPYADRINNIIAWFWSDLHPNSGSVHYQQTSANQWVIQFSSYGEFFGDGLIDAQVILNRNGKILLQYNNVKNGIEQRGASIGIENADGSDGLQVAFNPRVPYIKNELAVSIDRANTWLSVDTDVHSIRPNETRIFDLDYTANQTPAIHTAKLTLRPENDQHQLIPLDVELTITPDISPPARVDSLSILETGFDQVSLNWATIADAPSNQPNLAYKIAYSTNAISTENFAQARQVMFESSADSLGQINTVSFGELQPQTQYYFAAIAIDEYGNESAISNSPRTITLRPPEVSINREPISLTLAEGQRQTHELILNNTGDAPLSFRFDLREPDPAALTPQKQSRVLATSSNGNEAKKMSDTPLMQGTYVEGQIIVRFAKSASLQARATLLNKYSARKIKHLAPLGIEVWQLPKDASIMNTMQSLSKEPSVKFVEPNYKQSATFLPNDPLLPDLWGLHNTGSLGGVEGADIKASQAWDIETGSHNVVVAVIDTGVAYNHPDLSPNMWVNPLEIPGNGEDDDLNGYVDDVYGYDFTGNDSDPNDDNGHGSHVAGTIGADGDNGIGVVGVNHNVSIMSVKFLGQQGDGETFGAVASIVYAVDNGADIINASWGGGPHSDSLYVAIEYARDNNVLFVAAAGNDSSNNDTFPAYPASYDLDNIISVASSTRSDGISSFSNVGSISVDIAAPGSDIVSTVLNDSYAPFDGTSMASPHVAGAAALLKAYSPRISAAEMKAVLLRSADSIESHIGLTASGGRLNLLEALLQTRPTWVDFASDFSGQLEASDSTSLTLDFDSSDSQPGTYEINLVLTSNDPNTTEVIIPVTLTISPDEVSPDAITDLSASDPTESSAVLRFTAVGDDGGVGRASSYHVRYHSEEITQENWLQSTSLDNSFIPKTAGEDELVVLEFLPSNTLVWLAVAAVDNAGNTALVSNSVSIQTLNESLTVSPNPIPDINLLQGESTTVQVLLENTGEVTINSAARITEPNEPNTLNAKSRSMQYFASQDIAKNEVDYRIGSPVTTMQGGPDNFGYTWEDSNGNNVAFNWEDISASGEELSFFFSDDSVARNVDIGFSFPFYENAYSELSISSNGFISFNDSLGDGCCSGRPLPSADSFNNLIAWLWRDLHPRSGRVHTQNFNNDRFVIQFTNWGEYAGQGLIDVQVILFANGNIMLQYDNVRNGIDRSSGSIGIENADNNDGLQVAFNSNYVKDELAILFSVGWLKLETSEMVIPIGESRLLTLEASSHGLPEGQYIKKLVIDSNDLNRPKQELEVILNVEPGT